MLDEWQTTSPLWKCSLGWACLSLMIPVALVGTCDRTIVDPWRWRTVHLLCKSSRQAPNWRWIPRDARSTPQTQTRPVQVVSRSWSRLWICPIRLPWCRQVWSGGAWHVLKAALLHPKLHGYCQTRTMTAIENRSLTVDGISMSLCRTSLQVTWHIRISDHHLNTAVCRAEHYVCPLSEIRPTRE
jgi:hypothetical protein